MKSIYDVIKKACLTEKAMGLQERTNQIVLKVDRKANKLEIKEAAEKLFKIKVDKVRTASMPGRRKRVGLRMGYTSEWKKAILTLAEGQKLDFLEQL